jgi:hypothetical protein
MPHEIGGVWCHYKGDRIELELFPLDAVADAQSASEDPPDADAVRVWMPRRNFYDTVERLAGVAQVLRRVFGD